MNANQQQALMLFYHSRKTAMGLRRHIREGWPTGSLDFEGSLRRAEKRLEDARRTLFKLGLSLEDYWRNHEALAAYDAQHELEFEQRLSCIHYVQKSIQMPRERRFRPNEDCCGHGGRESSHDVCTRCPHYREITPDERADTGWGGP